MCSVGPQANVAKGREAGICAQPGQELKDGVKFPPMQEEQSEPEISATGRKQC